MSTRTKEVIQAEILEVNEQNALYAKATNTNREILQKLEAELKEATKVKALIPGHVYAYRTKGKERPGFVFALEGNRHTFFCWDNASIYPSSSLLDNTNAGHCSLEDYGTIKQALERIAKEGHELSQWSN